MFNKQMKRWFTSLGVLLIIGVIGGLLFPAVTWGGSVQRQIVVHLRDNNRNSPIEDASVSYLSRSDQHLRDSLTNHDFAEYLLNAGRIATTDSRGEAQLKAEFGAGGGCGTNVYVGRYSANGEISVTHPDYEAVTGLLQNFLQRKKIPLHTLTLEITIFLNRTKTVEQTGAANPHACGTSGISPAEQGRMPEASGDT